MGHWNQGRRFARPVRQGRQDRSVRRCWCRQDCAYHGAHQQRCQGTRRLLRVRWCRRAHPRRKRSLPRNDRVWCDQDGPGRGVQGCARVRSDERAPGARARVALTGLAVAEYFRDDEGQDVLLFVDNIFRFTQACSEVSALLGRIPSAVGYQPTLATDLGALQERIASTKVGSITSVQAVYVPADDLTDPSPATTFAHLDAN